MVLWRCIVEQAWSLANLSYYCRQHFFNVCTNAMVCSIVCIERHICMSSPAKMECYRLQICDWERAGTRLPKLPVSDKSVKICSNCTKTEYFGQKYRFQTLHFNTLYLPHTGAANRDPVVVLLLQCARHSPEIVGVWYYVAYSTPGLESYWHLVKLICL